MNRTFRHSARSVTVCMLRTHRVVLTRSRADLVGALGSILPIDPFIHLPTRIPSVGPTACVQSMGFRPQSMRSSDSFPPCCIPFGESPCQRDPNASQVLMLRVPQDSEWRLFRSS